MGRSVVHTHAVKGKTVVFHPYSYDGAAPGSGYWHGETLCGERGGGLSGKPGEAGLAAFVQAHNLSSTCPKCAKLYGAAKLAKLAGRVRIEQRHATTEERQTRGYKVDGDYEPFRSWWRVFIDGIERASIVNERGFGTLWEIRQLKREGRSYGWTGREVGTVQSSRHNRGESEGVSPIHRASKESAAAACLALYEAGLLPTAAEMAEAEQRKKADEIEREAERERNAAERARERNREEAERAERLAEAREALATMAARPDLTNLELAGIASIRKLLGITEAKESKS